MRQSGVEVASGVQCCWYRQARNASPTLAENSGEQRLRRVEWTGIEMHVPDLPNLLRVTLERAAMALR